MSFECVLLVTHADDVTGGGAVGPVAAVILKGEGASVPLDCLRTRLLKNEKFLVNNSLFFRNFPENT